MKMTKEGKLILIYGLALIAVLMALGMLGIFDLTLGILHGTVLVLLSATLLMETLLEGKFDPKNKGQAIELFIVGVALIFAFIAFMNYTVPESMRGVAAGLYVILALTIVIEANV